MKSVVIILSVLFAANMVCATKESLKYWQGFEACARRLGFPPNELRMETIICAAATDGEILYQNGDYHPVNCLRKLHLFISDPIRLQKALDIYFRCDQEAVQSGEVGINKSVRFLICGSDIIRLFDRE